MENCARRVTSEGSEETIMSITGPPATPDRTSNFHTALEESISSSLDEVALGDCIGAGSSMEPESEYFSARVKEMLRNKSRFSSAAEHEIEHSRVHWSEVSGLSDFLKDNKDCEEVDRENEEVFTELMNDLQWKHHKWGEYFHKRPFFKLGRKIAEGGQAKIFEVMGIDGNVFHNILLKVFKRGLRLSDLRKQWPCGILQPGVLSGARWEVCVCDEQMLG